MNEENSKDVKKSNVIPIDRGREGERRYHQRRREAKEENRFQVFWKRLQAALKRNKDE